MANTTMKLIWKSPNGKWEIYDDSDAIKLKLDWNDPYSEVAQVYVTDGWYAHYATIDVAGRVGFGKYDTYDLNVKTVKEKAFSILRQMYLEKKKKSSKKSVLPYRYFVYAWANKRDARWYKGDSGKVYKGETDKKYFQKYETAKAYAKKLWNGLSDTQKTYFYVTIGRFSDSYESIKDIPKNYSWVHAGEISKDNPIKWLN